ncbi:hypothetical protein FGG08_002502 [Glutinoglossum americanum]|uniref:Uncharacterized protein n=1 Tax=Glutinoglossum americanum TaxID=1670608 RepID=A0A9P8I9I4_9PEZI|nr:hypothetical protein FGG08_002502 [Glutinoglossum americanum]
MFSGHMAFTFLFRQHDCPGQTDGVLIGLGREKLQLILADLLSSPLTALEDYSTDTVIHPVSFFGSLLKILSNEDAEKIHEKVEVLKGLEEQISSKPISKLGKISVQLNDLRSGLSTLRTVTDLMLAFVKDLENSEIINDGNEVLKLADFPKRDGRWSRLNDQLHRTMDNLREVKQYCQSYKLNLQCLQQSIDISIAVISNLMTQNNTKWNRRVAEATRRDSSAMKVIALLGLLFLPGTFMSALFAMPLFNWDNWPNPSTTRGSVMKAGFWVYWAITIPITVSLILCFSIYVKHQERGDWKDDEEVGFIEGKSPEG